jgi:dihydroflavonol-4-reductase
MRVVVTGSAGLVGGHVSRALLDRGHDVTGLVRTASSWPAPDGVRVVRGDVTRLESLQAAFAGHDAVVHCAAVYSYDQPVDLVHGIAVGGTRSVIGAAAAAGIRRVVVTSSSVTCGSAATPTAVDERHEPADEFRPAYFAAKVDQERAAIELGRELGVEVVVACPTVVLGGPDRKLVPSNAIVARYLLDLSRSTYPGGCNVVSADDVGTGHVVLLERGEPGQRYLLGGDNLTWRSLHGLVGDLAGVGGPYAETPTSLVSAVATVAEWWSTVSGAAPAVSTQEAGTVGRYFWYDSALAHELGWSARPAVEAVAASLAWLIASDHLPRWARDSLRPRPEVHLARPLVPRPLDTEPRERRARRPVSVDAPRGRA